MIQSVLLFKLLLLCLVVQKAFADDPLVSKEIPASIKCHRNRGANKGLRDMEKKAASTKYYEACYDYTINQDDECELMNQRVVDLYNFAYGDDTIYEVETPIISPSNVYPNDKICFFEIGKRKKNFVYQYFFPDLYQQDLEGSLTIVDSGNTAVVTEGTCKDFFEFREKQFDDETYPNELVTCGNIADPRIQFGVDVASALTLVFKSDQMKGLQGLSLSVLEHKPPPDDDDDGKRKKRNIEVPRGLKGARGDTGKQGVPGEPGSNGIPGKDGLKGIKGQRGIPGVTGPKGDQGLPGKVGIPGDIGTTGRIGIPCSCLSFTNCEPGTPGRKGAKGLKGSLGDVGPRGDSGRPGIPGLRGMPGEIGRKGDKGINGTKGLPGPRGDQGFPGLRGKPGPPGPPGLGGCPLPSEKELPRHIREVEHILSTIAELYNNLGVEKQMPGDEFYDYIMKKPIHEKDGLSDHLYRDERRVTRSTKSSTDCNGILVIPGPKGCPGIPGLPGGNGRKGLPGVPGIDGTSGKAGVPGPPGLQGAKGTDGINGPKGLKGEKGDTGLPGDPGYCRCFQNKEEIKASRNTFLQRSGGNGTLRKQGPRGPRGQKGTQGSVGENGSPGSPGWRGPKGFKGNKGVSGRTGSNGKPGSKGRLGPPGIPGLTGPPGPPGPPGCVCNNLIILLDKYGFVRHTKSPDLRVDGNGTKQENISTVFYFKPNVTCIRNDSGPAIIGLKGVQGLPGYPGANGDPGISGLPGMDGVPGMHGSYGDQGLIGRTGIKGSRGKQGQKGKAGINGKQGSPGSNATCILGIRRNLIAVKCPRGCSDGLDGAIGDKGDAGPKGLQSLKGFKGTRGLPGPRGVAGKTGLHGEEGSVGLPGVKGPPGLTGLPGAVGPAGPAGPPGSSDTCPEYDGVDFDKLLSPSKEDIKLIKLLINTSNPELAARLTNREFPLLRELAKLITGGYKFRTARCPELDRPTNGTVLFRRYNNRNNQIVATFYCNEGFSLKGPKFLSCIHGHGKWSSSPPVCVRQ